MHSQIFPLTQLQQMTPHLSPSGGLHGSDIRPGRPMSESIPVLLHNITRMIDLQKQVCSLLASTDNISDTVDSTTRINNYLEEISATNKSIEHLGEKGNS